jgi:hypothetical protein
MKLKLFNIQFSKIFIFYLKKKPLRMKSYCESFLKYTGISPVLTRKMVSGEPTALRQKD